MESTDSLLGLNARLDACRSALVERERAWEGLVEAREASRFARIRAGKSRIELRKQRRRMMRARKPGLWARLLPWARSGDPRLIRRDYERAFSQYKVDTSLHSDAEQARAEAGRAPALGNEALRAFELALADKEAWMGTHDPRAAAELFALRSRLQEAQSLRKTYRSLVEAGEEVLEELEAILHALRLGAAPGLVIQDATQLKQESAFRSARSHAIRLQGPLDEYEARLLDLGVPLRRQLNIRASIAESVRLARRSRASRRDASETAGARALLWIEDVLEYELLGFNTDELVSPSVLARIARGIGKRVLRAADEIERIQDRASTKLDGLEVSVERLEATRRNTLLSYGRVRGGAPP